MDETIIALLSELDLCHAMKADLIHPQNRVFKSVCTDSRKVTPDDLFIALSGERFDGHDFIPDVVHKGCRGVLVSRKLDVPDDVAMFVFDDVLKAFGMLAEAVLEKRRSLGNFKTFAVTGSNGKTTTKELLSLLLEAQGKTVLKTEGNFNNFVGLPMTALRLKTSHDAAVLEMGANAPGEIAYLSSIGKPDTAIITCIGSAHLEGFGSIEGVAAAKGEMIRAPHLKKIVLPSETRRFFENCIPETVTPVWVGENCEKVCYKNIRATLENIEFDIATPETSAHIVLPLLGTHNAGNFARAFAALDAPHFKDGEINKALTRIKLPSGRLERWTNDTGVSFLHDAYNANPSSMAEAIRLMRMYSAPKVLILGDMRELGPESPNLHKTLGHQAADVHPVRILCIGDSAQYIRDGAIQNGYPTQNIHCANSDALDNALEWLKPALTADTVCLIKGSRGVRLERVLDFFNARRR